MSRESVFEQTWRLRPGPSPIRCVRRDHFDAAHALFYAPLRYECDGQAVTPSGIDVDDASVTRAFQSLVRDEFAARTGPVGSPPVVPTLGPPKEVDLYDLANEMLASAERELVYGESARNRTAQFAKSLLPERLHSLFSTPEFGVPQNRTNAPVEWFRAFLEAKRDERPGSWILAVPSLPFRDQNPFRVTNAPGVVTLAEVAFLLRLHAASLAVYQLMPGGMHAVVLADGTLYAEALGVSEAAAREFMSKLRRLRNELNLTGTVSIIDLRELIEDAARYRGVELWSLVDDIEDRLRVGLGTRDWDGSGAMTSLIAGMRWNVNWRSANITPDEIWAALACDARELLDTANHGELGGMVVRASLRYAAINVAIRFLEPVSTLLPDALRATVHPKPAQLGLPRYGSVSPWNGVAVVSGDYRPMTTKHIEVHPWFRLARHSESYIPLADVRQEGEAIAYVRPGA